MKRIKTHKSLTSERGFRMKKIIALLLFVIISAAALCSCAAGKSSDTVRVEVQSNNDYSLPYTSTTAVKNLDEVKFDAELTTDIEQKIIKTYRLSLETKEYDSALSSLRALTSSFGGYISSSNERSGNSYYNNSKAARYGEFTIRIPNDKLEEYVAEVSKGCNVTQSQLTTDDITDSYYNLQSTLDSLKEQENRLMEMMKTASTLDYLIKLDDKLTSVRSQINDINYKLQYYDKAVDYSYVYISVNEVIEYTEKEEPTFWQRLGEAFSGTFVKFGEIMGEVFIVLIWVLPFLILGGIIAVLIIVCNKKKIKKAPREKTDENENSIK